MGLSDRGCTRCNGTGWIPGPKGKKVRCPGGGGTVDNSSSLTLGATKPAGSGAGQAFGTQIDYAKIGDVFAAMTAKPYTPSDTPQPVSGWTFDHVDSSGYSVDSSGRTRVDVMREKYDRFELARKQVQGASGRALKTEENNNNDAKTEQSWNDFLQKHNHYCSTMRDVIKTATSREMNPGGITSRVLDWEYAIEYADSLAEKRRQANALLATLPEHTPEWRDAYKLSEELREEEAEVLYEAVQDIQSSRRGK